MRKFSVIIAAALAVAVLAAGCSHAAEPRAVPPNMIGLMLTPYGFDGKIYEPGQADIGTTGWFANWGNKLVLMEKAGFAVKESFISDGGSGDKEDHRCIVGPKREPMTLDVRLLFAMPDYKRPEGQQAILRMGLLGKFQQADPNLYGGNRVLVLDASTVYEQQVQQEVRGKIRDVCIGYPSVEAVFKAIEKNGTKDGFTDVLRTAVGTVLAEKNSPLLLVAAVASNVKPDPSVIEATAASVAADKLVEAMTKIDAFISADKTGTRASIYKLMVLQAMADRAGTKGGTNTLFMTDVGKSGDVVPVPVR